MIGTNDLLSKTENSDVEEQLDGLKGRDDVTSPCTEQSMREICIGANGKAGGIEDAKDLHKNVTCIGGHGAHL